MLKDCGIIEEQLHIYCDNQSAMNISKNPVQHSRTKHIKIRHHFIRELVESKELEINYLPTELQLADLFTKLLDNIRFEYLDKSIVMVMAKL